MKSILVFLFAVILNSSYSQTNENKIPKRTKKFVKEVTNLIKSSALCSDSLNWDEINKEVSFLPFGNNDSTNNELIISFFTIKLRNAGDKHSFFITPSNIKSFLSHNTKPKAPEGKYLEKGIGFIKVPRCVTFDNIKDRDFANSIRNQIKIVDTVNEVTSWVVDLRGNGGGNMWPMLAGLNALTSDGVVGYTTGNPKLKEGTWIVENGKINYSNQIVDTFKIKNLHCRIAVLIDSMTGSSGEMTAISFIGLPNVKVFGTPTSGYITANSTYYLSNGVQLYLATNYVADRTHKIYPERIFPDVAINPKANSTENDAVLEAAKQWLLEIKK